MTRDDRTPVLDRAPAFSAHGGLAYRRNRSGRGTAGFVSVLALLIGAVALHAHLSRSPLWTVRAIEVAGNRSISTSDLLARLGLSPGMPFWRISPAKARGFADENPRIRSCRVAWSFPRDLRVAVDEHESVLRVLGPTPLEMAVDGTLMAPHEALDPVDLPLLTGALPAGLGPGKKCGLAGPLEELLRFGRENAKMWKLVSEIEAAGNDQFRIYLRNGHKVILWSAGLNPELKRETATILAELDQQGMDDAVVDLRFRDQAVVRLPKSALADSTDTEGAAPAAVGAPVPRENAREKSGSGATGSVKAARGKPAPGKAGRGGKSTRRGA